MKNEEFIIILKERDKYEKMKENVRNVSEKQENMGLNSVNSKKLTSSETIDVTCDFNWLKTCELKTKIE